MPDLPYRSRTLPVAARVDDLLARMTIHEKAALMLQPGIVVGENGQLTEGEPGLGVDSTEQTLGVLGITHYNLIGAADDSRSLAEWHNRLQARAAATRLGIPVTLSSDPRHHFNDNPAIAALSGAFSTWPEPIGLAALRSADRVREFADIVRQEYVAVGLRAALHPQLDLATEPRWGRIHHTLGEDADLASKLGVAYLLGLQGDALGSASVSAMVKHFPGGGPQKDGEDPHFAYGREQVYSGDGFDYHLRPFRAAIAAGARQVMPYYGMPVGTPYAERGFAFDSRIITDLLRGELGFEGIVCTDWKIITGGAMMGEYFPARAWGVEHLTPLERSELVIQAGCDQLGGESDPTLITELVRLGRVSESRIDESVKRLLTEKFLLGLFDQPLVDVDHAVKVVGSREFRERGELAQRESFTVLTNPTDLLPLDRTVRLYVEGVDPELAARYATIVSEPGEADYAVIRLKAPFESRPGFFESVFHAGSLAFDEHERARIARLLSTVPTVVDLFLDRPAVVPELAAEAAALLASFGSDDSALLDVVFGIVAPLGQLPFDMPSSMEAVIDSSPDAAFDTKDPLFRFGHGLRYVRSGDPAPPSAVAASSTVAPMATKSRSTANPVGEWELTVETPRGSQLVPLVIRPSASGLEGELADNPLSDVTHEGANLQFRAALKEPLPVKIRVRAEIDADTMHGTAKAAMFPLALSFVGVRVRI